MENKTDGEYKFTMEVSVKGKNVEIITKGDSIAFYAGIKGIMEKHPNMKLDLVSIINK